MTIGIDTILGFAVGIEYVPKGEVEDDESFLLIELGIIRLMITFG